MKDYRNKEVLITGGLGFIGSNLAIKLVELGANVTIVDVLWPDHGGNKFNIEPVSKDIQINFCDIRDKYAMNLLVQDKDFIFHLAGQCSHVLGQIDPYPDIDINIHGTAVLMECIKHHAPKAITVFTSTRGIYGSVKKLPAGEDTKPDPKGLYELSNLTAEGIIKFYGDVHGLKIVNLRLSNIYGERSQMKHDKFGVLNWFIRLALDGNTIKIFGDGKILRDFLYINDCVEAMLKVATISSAYNEVFNVGNSEYCEIGHLANTIVDVVGSGKWELVPFSIERMAQEPGNFYPDITKMSRMVNWHPSTKLREGIRRTSEYYRQNRNMYW